MSERTLKEYYNQNGLLHREDGPAVIYPDGGTSWYKNGKLHREDGPAIELSPKEDDDWKYWYINGRELTEVEIWLRSKKCLK